MCVKFSPKVLNPGPYPPTPHKHLYKFLVVHVIFSLNAGSDLIMTAQAKGECDRILIKSCNTKICDTNCKSEYGVNTIGFCYTDRNPNDTCVCRYPC